MALQFRSELTPAHVREATAGIFWRQVTKPLVLSGAAAVFAAAQGILWAVLPGFGWQWHAALAGMMSAGLAGGLAFASSHYQSLALANFARFKGAPVEASLERDSYRYAADWGSGSIEWSRFQSLWCLDGVWVLLQHAEGGASVLLPSADLDEEARGFLRQRMAEVRAEVLD